MLLLVACNLPPADGGNGDPPASPEHPPEEAEIVPTSSDSLRLSVDVRPVAGVGELIPISLHIENTTDRTLDLYLRGRTIAFDLIVTDAAGGVVWRRLEGEIIPAILRIEPLPASESLNFEAVWDQRTNAGEPVEPGVYTVHGELLTEADPLVTPPEAIQIERP
jgi:hypothetical protein